MLGNLNRFSAERRQAEARKRQETFPRIKWSGKTYELAQWLQAAFLKGNIEAKDWTAATEMLAPHFENRKGEVFGSKSLAASLTNKRARDAGRK